MKQGKHVCDLKSCFLCKNALSDWIPAIAGHKQNIIIKKGQLLFKEDAPVTGIYFIYEGNIKVHKKWDKDKELILRFAKSGDIVGHLGLGRHNFYPVSATAIDQVTVCYVDMGFFESTLNVNHQLAITMMRFFANELQESEKRMRNLAHMSVKGRVAQALISLQNQFGVDNAGCLNIELSRQDLAAFTGAAYESLFRTIIDFTEKKLISVAGKSIAINNTDLLLKIIAEDNL